MAVKFTVAPTLKQDLEWDKKPTSDEYAYHLAEDPLVKSVGSKGISGHTTVSKKVNGKEETVEDTVEKMWAPPLHMVDLHTVVVSGSMTVNLGNYESAKITVSLSIPTVFDGINDAYEFASNWVSDKIEAAVKKAKGG